MKTIVTPQTYKTLLKHLSIKHFQFIKYLGWTFEHLNSSFAAKTFWSYYCDVGTAKLFQRSWLDYNCEVTGGFFHTPRDNYWKLFSQNQYIAFREFYIHIVNSSVNDI